MARLSAPQGFDGEPPLWLALDVTYAQFAHGWVYYDILPTADGLPILNDDVLKSRADGPPRKPGSVWTCEDEFCSLLPAMRRFLETGMTAEWTPVEPDVTLRMAPDEWRAGHVCLTLEIDSYQWLGMRGYGGCLVSLTFDCRLAVFEAFYKDLRAEFVRFRDDNDITGFNRAHGFERPWHGWF